MALIVHVVTGFPLWLPDPTPAKQYGKVTDSHHSLECLFIYFFFLTGALLFTCSFVSKQCNGAIFCALNLDIVRICREILFNFAKSMRVHRGSLSLIFLGSFCDISRLFYFFLLRFCALRRR